MREPYSRTHPLTRPTHERPPAPPPTPHPSCQADAGYRVVVPDLYRGKAGYDAEEAKHNMQALDFPAAVQDVAGAAAWLKAEGSGAVATIGFCMGGALALAAGCLAPAHVDAAVGFYGVPSAALCDMATMAVPAQGHFGAQDKAAGFADVAAAQKLAAQLASAPAAAASAVFIYDSVGHAFLNDDAEGIERRAKLGQGDHDSAAVALAWERVFAFFAAHLRRA